MTIVETAPDGHTVGGGVGVGVGVIVPVGVGAGALVTDGEGDGGAAGVHAVSEIASRTAVPAVTVRLTIGRGCHAGADRARASYIDRP
ncbi:hypothetical protein GCM10017596_23900 [Microbacterium keratanolyticum]|uniref:Uncharacterized protein n=1 Tax=Microbacterium keratanolyticum TaxID=67574 RepID=A0A9W6M9B4_9MICO|nr:hypothetical protein GCM10017596_23900 [Microbacterium keratanolyticum]